MSLRSKKKYAPARLYGQENEPGTWAMAKMNMIIHDMEGEIQIGDTFRKPKFRKGLPPLIAELRQRKASFVLEEAAARRRQGLLDELEAKNGHWFDTEMDKLDRWAEDRRAGLKTDLEELDQEN